MRPPIHLLPIVLVSLAGSQTSWAQEPDRGGPERVDAIETGPEWKAQAQAGLLMTTGNSSTTTFSSAWQGSRSEGKNKVLLLVSGAFARSTIFVADDSNLDGFIGESEIERVTRTSARSWLLRPRYERSLDEQNALFLAAALASDKPTGKTLVGSGQFGYSRKLVASKVHSLALESGYDFSYEKREAAGSPSLSIHSLRIFGGYQGTLSSDTTLHCDAEGLFNLNTEDGAAGSVDRFEDTRVETRVALTTRLYDNLSVGFSFLARYDSDPAPRPNLALPYAIGFRPLADRLDTRTEAALILSFL